MADPSFRTTQMNGWIVRWQAGDRAAADQLLRAVQDRLEHLTRKMLRTFPNVRGDADTGDIFQNAVLRLLNALRHMHLASTRDFFGLAAAHIRRELLDVARRVSAGKRGRARRQNADGDTPDLVVQLADASPSVDELERWCQLHEAAAKLPAALREVFDLVFYHGWTQPQIAELFGCDERTIRRHWRSACVQLRDALHGELPCS